MLARLFFPLVWAILLALFLSLGGCSPPVGMRKITAWGIWAVPFGAPVGIGYWHSEHGIGVGSEESDKPTDALKALPKIKERSDAVTAPDIFTWTPIPRMTCVQQGWSTQCKEP